MQQVDFFNVTCQVVSDFSIFNCQAAKEQTDIMSNIWRSDPSRLKRYKIGYMRYFGSECFDAEFYRFHNWDQAHVTNATQLWEHWVISGVSLLITQTKILGILQTFKGWFEGEISVDMQTSKLYCFPFDEMCKEAFQAKVGCFGCSATTLCRCP